MKINEVITSLKTYIATVRVVVKNTTSTARTSVNAESPNQAFLIFCRLYGVGNVGSISEIVNESPRTCQIQAQATISSPVVHRHQPKQKNAFVQNSFVDENLMRPKERRISAEPIPFTVKHQLVRNKLTKQFMRQSNIIKPTQDDVRVAKSRVETELKRIDLEHQKAMKARQQMAKAQQNLMKASRGVTAS